MQSFFSTSKYAGIVATIVYFLSVMSNYFLGIDDTSKAWKIIASLLPQAALSQGAKVFVNYECTGVGMNSSTAKVLYNNYSFRIAMLMLFVSFVLFMLIGMWLDAVLPSKYGKARNPVFCCMPSFYSCCWNRRQRRAAPEQADNEQMLLASNENDEFEVATVGAENFEAPPMVCRRLEATGDMMKVEGLSKEFGNF